MGRLFAGNDRNNREHILITSFPDRNSLGGEGTHLQPGPGSAHTLPSEVSQPTNQASCVCHELGSALGIRREPTGYAPWSPGAYFLVGGNNRGQLIAMDGETVLTEPQGLDIPGMMEEATQVETMNEKQPAEQRS